MGRRPALIGVLLAAGLVLASPAASRTPALWPFTASSPWNHPLGAGARYTSSTCDRAVDAEAADPRPPWINTTAYSVPIYFASSSDLQEQFLQGGAPGLPFPTGYNWGSFHVPLGASPDPASDHNLALIEPSGHFSDETWGTHLNLDWITGVFARQDLVHGDGFAPIEGFGPRAADASSLAGLIRTWELQAGSIRHALAISLPQLRLSPRAVPPARSIDNNHLGYAGPIPLGQLLAIPRQISPSRLGLRTHTGRLIAWTLKRYGAYVVDSGGTASLYAEPGADSLVNPARAPSAGSSDMVRIIGALRCVTNNRPGRWGGGGRPLAPAAPPFS